MTKIFNFTTGEISSCISLVANEDCDQVKHFFKLAHEGQASLSDSQFLRK